MNEEHKESVCLLGIVENHGGEFEALLRQCDNIGFIRVE
jgi:hypothetical protein